LSNDPTGTNAFELSRIYGQGWTTARKLLASNGDAGPREAAARNPHRTAEKRASWTQGFMAGLRSRAGVTTAPGRNFWRPAAKKIPAGGGER